MEDNVRLFMGSLLLNTPYYAFLCILLVCASLFGGEYMLSLHYYFAAIAALQLSTAFWASLQALQTPSFSVSGVPQ